MLKRLPHFIALLLLTTTAPLHLAAQSFIEHLDPPFWWVGMPVDTVQIMVHGDRVAQLAPVVEYPGVSIARVVHGDGPNYAFIYLHISPDAQPGTLAIQWRDATNRKGKTVGRTAFEFQKRERQREAPLALNKTLPPASPSAHGVPKTIEKRLENQHFRIRIRPHNPLQNPV